jgi:DNA-binding NarL/FixJ family response regulator
MIRLLVVDDHPVVREGLAAILADQPDFTVVGAVGSADALLALAAREHPSVVLLDLELPGMSGIESVRALAPLVPEARVIAFTAYDNDELVFGALEAGVRGYLLKGAPAEEIARAVRAVAAGGSYLEPRVAAKVLAASRSRRAGLLTERERQVVRLIGAGRSNKQIAHELGITERTVKFHVRSAMNKLGAENRAQAFALATARRLL